MGTAGSRHESQDEKGLNDFGSRLRVLNSLLHADPEIKRGSYCLFVSSREDYTTARAEQILHLRDKFLVIDSFTPYLPKRTTTIALKSLNHVEYVENDHVERRLLFAAVVAGISGLGGGQVMSTGTLGPFNMIAGFLGFYSSFHHANKYQWWLEESIIVSTGARKWDLTVDHRDNGEMDHKEFIDLLHNRWGKTM